MVYYIYQISRPLQVPIIFGSPLFFKKVCRCGASTFFTTTVYCVTQALSDHKVSNITIQDIIQGIKNKYSKVAGGPIDWHKLGEDVSPYFATASIN